MQASSTANPIASNPAAPPIRDDSRFAHLRRWRVYLPIAAGLLFGFGLLVAPIGFLIAPMFQHLGFSPAGAWRMTGIGREILDLAILLAIILVWERRGL